MQTSICYKKEKQLYERIKLYERTNCLSILFVRKKKKMTCVGTKHEENEKKVFLVGCFVFFNIFSIYYNVMIRSIDSIQISVSTIVTHPYVPCIINTMCTAVKQESYKSIFQKKFKIWISTKSFLFQQYYGFKFYLFCGRCEGILFNSL